MELKEVVERYIEIIKGEVERTLVIMDDFLDYTKIKVDKNFETSTKNLFIIGDCGGSSHSLSVAAAEGVHVARFITT